MTNDLIFFEDLIPLILLPEIDSIHSTKTSDIEVKVPGQVISLLSHEWNGINQKYGFLIATEITICLFINIVLLTVDVDSDFEWLNYSNNQ